MAPLIGKIHRHKTGTLNVTKKTLQIFDTRFAGKTVREKFEEEKDVSQWKGKPFLDRFDLSGPGFFGKSHDILAGLLDKKGKTSYTLVKTKTKTKDPLSIERDKMENVRAVELSDSLEDYIEAIFRIILEKRQVKPKDIVKAMNVAGASVTGALRALTEKGLIHYAPYDEITLTPQGAVVAEEIYNRHRKLKSFLRDLLRVPEKEADENACRMEHVVSPSVIDRLVRFAEFIENCPRGGRLWISGFEHDCDPIHSRDHCRDCILATVERVGGSLSTAKKEATS